LAAVLTWFVLAAAAASPMAGTGGVAIRAEARPELGRLLLIWPGPADVRLEVDGGMARLRASHPIAGDPAPAVAKLGAWLAGLQPTSSPGELVLQLREGVGAQLRQLHPRLTVIELAAGPPAPDPPRAAPPTSAEPARLRVGQHPGFARLVIESPGPAKAERDARSKQLVLQAGAPLPPEAARQAASLGRFVRAATVAGDRLELTLAPGTRAEAYPLPPRRLVVDFRAPEAVADENGPAGLIAPAAGGPDTTPPASRRPRPVPMPRPLPDAFPAEGGNAPAAPMPATNPAPAAGPQSLKPLAVRVTAEATRTAAELRFFWNATVPAAMFQQGGILWVAFGGRPAEVRGWSGLDHPGLRGWVELLGSEATLEGHVFRLALRQPARIAVTRAGEAWRVRLTPPAGTDQEAVPAHHLVRDVGAGRLVAEVAAGKLAEATDPVTGERLGILLTTDSSPNHPVPVRLVDLELLASAQGLAWRPLADGITAKVDAQGFSLTRPGGLRLLPDEVREAVVARTGVATAAAAAEDQAGEAGPGQQPAAAPPAAPLGLGTLAATTPRDRQAARSELLGRLARLADGPRARARLELARLQLADGLGPEARVTLEQIDTAGLPQAVLDGLQHERDAIAGAAAALAGKHDAALATLQAPTYDGDPEVALWRAFAAAGAGHPGLVAPAWARAGDVLAAYPEPLRGTMGRAIAAGLLEQDKAEEAAALARMLRAGISEPQALARLDLIEAMAALRERRRLEAEGLLRAAAARGDHDARVDATFLLTVAHEEQGTLSPDAALRELLGQRSGWHGHPKAPGMLDQLAARLARAGAHGEALAVWQEALAQATEPTAAAMRRGMRDLLLTMLQDAGPAALSPVAVAALFRSHAGLLGGDTLPAATRLHLAAKAAEAGLHDSAAALLQASAAPPGDGAASAPTDAKAVIEQLVAALGDLDRTGAGLPDTDLDAIARLRAEATLDGGDPRGALASLGGRADDEADRLRRAAFVALGDWRGIADASEAVLARRAQDPVLDRSGAEAAVWLTLAQARLGDAAAAAATAARYRPLLPDGPLPALLALASATTVTADSTDRLSSAVGALATTARSELARLPPLGAAGDGQAGLKSASARSGPEG
jgi:hypothetical protein